MIHFKRFIHDVSVMLLLFGILNLLLLDTQYVLAQTGAPPPPTEPVFLPPVGSLLVDPVFPAIPPANVPPLVGNGVLAVIPKNGEDALALVNVILCEKENIRGTLLVPASDQTDLIAKVEVVEKSVLPAAALPVAFTNPIKVFEITLFNAETGELITEHVDERALQFGIGLSPGVSPTDVALVHFDALENEYDVIDITGDPIKGIVKANLNESSTTEGIIKTEINRYTPFALVSTAVSPDLAKANTDSDNEDTPAQGETVSKVLATPTLNPVDTIDSASAQQINTQEGNGTANRALFGSTPDNNDESTSIFGAPIEEESSESTSEAISAEDASVASAYDSVESKSNQSNNNPLLNGFAVLVTSLGAGFGFFRWRFN